MSDHKLEESFRIRFTSRQLAALIGPLVAEQLLAISVGLADSLMVSTVGDAAISAVSLVDAVSNLMIFVFSAMAAGGAAVAGQYIGGNKKDKACSASQQLMMLLGVASVAMMALLYVFRSRILSTVFGKITPEVMAATNTYYSYVIASIPGIALYNGGAALLRTMEKSNISLRVSLLMNLINVVGNAVLLFVFHMDVAGVAIPTLVSRTVAAIIVVAVLYQPRHLLHLVPLKKYKPNKALMKNILYISIPSGAENGMFHLGRLVLFSLVSTFGTASIVANAVGHTLGNFQCFVGTAIDLGLATVVSECVGAKDYRAAKYYFKKIAKISYLVSAPVNLLIFACLPLIMRAYDLSPEAETLAVTIAIIHGSATMLLWVPTFSVPAVLRAAGDARFTMTVSMTTMWLLRVVLAYVLGRYLGCGVIGVWVAHAVIDWSVRSIIFIRRYRNGKWQEKAIKD